MKAEGLRWMGMAVLVPLLAGCSLFLEAPTVRVTQVQAVSLGLSGGTLRVDLDVENPNRLTLSADGFVYRFDIAENTLSPTSSGGSGAQAEAGPDDASESSPAGDEGALEPGWRTLLEGSYEDLVQLPADGGTSVTVEVPFDYGDLGPVLGRLLRRGEVEYRLSGLFSFRVFGGGVNVPFDQRGTFRP